MKSLLSAMVRGFLLWQTKSKTIEECFMTKEEYIKRMNEQEDWTPGWDAIEAE